MTMPAPGSDTAFLSAFETVLDRSLPPAGNTHPVLRAAMAHALLGGGKRLRPMLLAASMRLGEYDESIAMKAGAALEMLHSYSLVHDDLPAMDDDDFRRGRPSCHKVHGEAMAILAGDALQALAFETLADAVAQAGLDAAGSLAACREFARTAGPEELVGGQAADLQPQGELAAEEQVSWIHARKTAALIRCSIVLGARLGRLPEAEIEALAEAGRLLGHAFQAVDDLLDEDASREELGKTPGKDLALGKRTLPSAIGREATRERAEQMLERALELLPDREEAGSLREIAQRLVHRRF